VASGQTSCVRYSQLLSPIKADLSAIQLPSALEEDGEDNDEDNDEEKVSNAGDDEFINDSQNVAKE
jgi:hypothetical protein